MKIHLFNLAFTSLIIAANAKNEIRIGGDKTTIDTKMAKLNRVSIIHVF